MRNYQDVHPLCWRNNQLTIGTKTLARLEASVSPGMFFIVFGDKSRMGPVTLRRGRLLAEEHARLRRHKHCA
jgi:hypothetical protein